MVRRVFWMLGVSMLPAAQGFQLRVPAVLQPRAAGSRTVTSTPVSRSASSAPTEAPTAPAREGSADDDQSRQFDWNKHWYPVLSLEHTDPERAHAVELLGKDLVVWKNTEGKWATFDDRCPHRAAPLTEGRVEKDGSLLCAYHGWRFDSDGKCLAIPQSERGGKDEAQAAACAKVYPTQVAQGIIWVWGENGPDAGLESAVTPAALIPELDDVEGIESGRVTQASIYQRDLPYSWEIFMENVVDPAHVVVSHHGIMGSRDMAAPVRLKLLNPTFGKDGFTLQNNSPRGDGVDGYVQFNAPTLVTIDGNNKNGSMTKLVLYCVPTRPGWCRMVSSQMTVTPKESTGTKAKQAIPTAGGLQPHKLPVWLQHVLGHLFMHQDMVFLHGQERILASADYDISNYAQGVFVPAAADTGVLALKKWIKEIGSGGPVWSKGCDPALPPRERARDALFDVYEVSTMSCDVLRDS